MASSGPSKYTKATPDVELISAIKKGVLDAFTALVQRHERSLINFFFHFSWDRQFAEDCAQEVFVKLYKHLDSYEPKAKFTTFLYRVARNHWIDKVRASKGKTVSLESSTLGEEGRALKDRLPSGAESPVDTLTRQETRDLMKSAIERLPEDQKMVVVFSEIQGLKYQEISEIMGVPVGTIKSRMFTAMQRLKEILTDEL